MGAAYVSTYALVISPAILRVRARDIDCLHHCVHRVSVVRRVLVSKRLATQAMGALLHLMACVLDTQYEPLNPYDPWIDTLCCR